MSLREQMYFTNARPLASSLSYASTAPALSLRKQLDAPINRHALSDATATWGRERSIAL